MSDRNVFLICTKCKAEYNCGEMYVLYGLMKCEECGAKLIKRGKLW
jgi:predicted RNA-binding Zn-ribbon protein involved in translation (DUF1610 family)